MLHDAIEHGVMAACAEGSSIPRRPDVGSAALFAHFGARGHDGARRLLSAITDAFGVHAKAGADEVPRG
jgi:6-phosphogluconate dehydrogenase (decarboxylating)